MEGLYKNKHLLKGLRAGFFRTQPRPLGREGEETKVYLSRARNVGLEQGNPYGWWESHHSSMVGQQSDVFR